RVRPTARSSTRGGVEPWGMEMLYNAGPGIPRIVAMNDDESKPVVRSREPRHSWLCELGALTVCGLVGVTMSMLPHFIAWRQSGQPYWIADHDDLLYLAIAAPTYFEHSYHLRDPARVEDRPTFYPWVQFIPFITVARVLNLGPLGT